LEQFDSSQDQKRGGTVRNGRIKGMGRREPSLSSVASKKRGGKEKGRSDVRVDSRFTITVREGE